MILNFEEIEEKENKNFKGGEGSFFVKPYADSKVKIMKCRLEKGSSVGGHTHDENCEVVYILSGKGVAMYEEGEEFLLPGQVHYCPMGKFHSIRNDEDEPLIFLAIVAEHH